MNSLFDQTLLTGLKKNLPYYNLKAIHKKHCSEKLRVVFFFGGGGGLGFSEGNNFSH